QEKFISHGFTQIFTVVFICVSSAYSGVAATRLYAESICGPEILLCALGAEAVQPKEGGNGGNPTNRPAALQDVPPGAIAHEFVVRGGRRGDGVCTIYQFS